MLSVLLQQTPQQHHPRTMATNKKCVNLDNLNPCIKKLEYAVRGPLVIRATEIEKELEQVCDYNYCDKKRKWSNDNIGPASEQ